MPMHSVNSGLLVRGLGIHVPKNKFSCFMVKTYFVEIPLTKYKTSYN